MNEEKWYSLNELEMITMIYIQTETKLSHVASNWKQLGWCN